MFLAAAADLGADLRRVQDVLGRIGITVAIHPQQEIRSGLAGIRLHIEDTSPEPPPLRTLSVILPLLKSLDVSDRVKERSKKAFVRLAQVEAEVHGVTLEDVHFHEVGAVDTLVDIVGAFLCLEQLEVRQTTCGPLPWFRGQVHCAHGTLPLPAPATLRLLEGKPVYPTEFTEELITPTGAVLLDQIVDEYAAGPEGRILKTGVGYGTKKIGTGLRLTLYSADAAGRKTEYVWVLESNVDHLTGEELGGFFDALMDRGALDVIYLPGVMKKNRPGGVLQVMCRDADLEMMQHLFFKYSLTLGLRITRTQRVILDRDQTLMHTPQGDLPAKAFTADAERLVRPEFEAVSKAAEEKGLSPAEFRLQAGKKHKD